MNTITRDTRRITYIVPEAEEGTFDMMAAVIDAQRTLLDDGWVLAGYRDETVGDSFIVTVEAEKTVASHDR